MPHISNPERHKKKAATLAPWKMEMKDFRYEPRAWSAQKVKRAKQGVFYLHRDGSLRKTEKRGGQQKPMNSTQGIKPTQPSAAVFYQWKKTARPVSWMETLSKSHLSQLCHGLCTVLPLCKQVCSSLGGGLQVCRHRRRHSKVMGSLRPQTYPCRSPRCWGPWGQKDPRQWALYPLSHSDRRDSPSPDPPIPGTQADAAAHRRWKRVVCFYLPVMSVHKSTSTASFPLNRFELWHLTRSKQPTQTPSIRPLSYLPGGETGGAHEMATGLNLHILVILRTDLTQLESGAHLTVQLILLLGG